MADQPPTRPPTASPTGRWMPRKMHDPMDRMAATVLTKMDSGGQEGMEAARRILERHATPITDGEQQP